ncbi:MAG: heavy metal translocating P-type ATPase, partial [Clostridiaceae bacterium]|nr:heavy metal translocating P-type ATPase [Clostridiaceae bacterium]
MRKKLLRVCAGGLLFAAGFVFGKQWTLFTAAYVLAGYDVVLNALRGLFRAQLLDENLLMAVASIGALSLGDFAEGAAVMLFYQIGELFQEYAVRRSRKSITALMELRPDSALRVSENGQVSEVPPEEVEVGDLILLKPGMRAPLDGVIIEGSGALDTAALTGESIPRDACPGDEVLGGSVSLSGALTLRVTRPYAQSAVSRILEMVEDAVAHKARSERFITRFARWYTPSVVGAAILLAVLPPLLGLGTWLI